MGAPAVVTPEAVPIDLRRASIGSRFLALLIDWAVQAALSFALLVAGVAIAFDEGGGWGIALVFVLFFLIVFGYPVVMETLWRGRTLGKAALGLRVVTVEGGVVRFRHAAVRAALGLVDFFLTSGAAAVVSVLVTRNNQRLGDLVAGTLVLRERTGLPAPRAATFSVPPGLEDYAATLDVSRVTAEDYQVVRAFLIRAPRLEPGVRYRLAVELADPLAAKVRPPPPAGAQPAAFLACVAAVHQARAATGERGAPGERAPVERGATVPGTGEAEWVEPAPQPPGSGTPAGEADGWRRPDGEASGGGGFAPLS